MKSETPRTDADAGSISDWLRTQPDIEIVAASYARQLEIELNELAAAARQYLQNSIPSAEHMAEWHKLKDALAAMPNEKS